MQPAQYTRKPRYPSPLRIDSTNELLMGVEPRQSPPVGKKKPLLTRSFHVEDPNEWRKIAHRHSRQLQTMLANARMGALRPKDALKSPFFKQLKQALAGERRLLQLTGQGRYLEAVHAHAFVAGDALLPGKKKKLRLDIAINNCQFAAHLLQDRLMLMASQSPKAGAGLLTIGRWLTSDGPSFRRELLREESSQLPRLMEAAARVDTAIVFVPKLNHPIPVRIEGRKPEATSMVRSFSALSLSKGKSMQPERMPPAASMWP